MDAPPARGTIVKTTDAPGRDHRVDAVERRDRGAQADDAEGGSDPVPRLRAGRHVARERRGLRPGARRGRRRAGRRRRQVQRRDARQDPHRQGGRRAGRSSAKSSRGWAAAARRRISRRCSSCSTCASRSRAPTRPRSPRWRRRRRALLANRTASPDVVFDQTIDAALSQNHPRRQPETRGDGGPVEPGRSRWRSTRRASPTRATSRSSSSAASRPRRSSRSSRPTSPACRRRTRRRPGATSASRRRRASSRRRSRWASRRRARWRSSSRGRSSTDDAHMLALRTMTLLLQSRLLDTIRQELGGTYSITATPDARQVPEAGIQRAHRVDVRSRARPRRWCSACSRRSRTSRRPTSRASRWAGSARRSCASTSRTARRTATSSTRSRAATRTATRRCAPVATLPDQIGALTGDAIQQAARTYLKSSNYVKVTLMPAK